MSIESTKKLLLKKRHLDALCIGIIVLILEVSFTSPVLALQDSVKEAPAAFATEDADTIKVLPDARDSDIEQRLTHIMRATNWFETPAAEVDQGVVFLSGVVASESRSAWALELARRTEGVVAVVNTLEVAEQSPWDFSASWREIRRLGTEAVQAAPLLLMGFCLLALTWALCLFTARCARSILSTRVSSVLLRQVLSRAIAIPVFLLGLYLVLQLSGLTSLALTILGGTGIVGLIIGFGFRDIAENFLSSILISSQRPFSIGDLIAVAGHQGFVQSVNTRSTLLMTLEGNHVQIPNSDVYKGTIVNYTANPKSRATFTVGIGYDDSIQEAQATALKVLKDHPAVVDDPEPLVLVESLGAATVNLSMFFWIDVSRYSQIRVLSAVIRLTKRAFDKANVSMPDEAREVVFPDGLPVQVSKLETESSATGVQRAEVGEESTPRSERDDDCNVNEAEGDLSSELEEISDQAASTTMPEGENLIS